MINKPHRITWHWLLYILSLLLLLSSTPSSPPPKHSYLDQETSLILKSIAGKPSHLLTKVTSSYTFCFRSSPVHSCLCLCALLLSSALLVFLVKSMLRVIIEQRIFFKHASTWGVLSVGHHFVRSFFLTSCCWLLICTQSSLSNKSLQGENLLMY